MIRVAILDDHYAIRLGLEAALRAQPDMTTVGAAGDPAELAPLLYRTAPDVLIVDYQLPGEDGLSVCLRLRAAVGSPALLMHSAFADDWLTVACVVAGVDGVLSKGATGRQLTEAVREVHAGRFARPEIAPEILRAAGDAIGPDDQPILGLLMHDTPDPEICRVLRLESGQLHERRARMLTALGGER